MEFHKVSLAEPSPRVLGKMKKGHKVRIVKGEGFDLFVKPENYDHITRCFVKGKGLHFALSPEEIAHNHGQGVFKKIGKAFKKVGKALKPVGHVLINEVAKLAPKLGESALTGLALAAGQPELIPLAQVVGKVGGRELGKLAAKEAHKGIDKSYGRRGNPPPSRSPAVPIINELTGQNSGVLDQANMGTYLANASLADLEGAIVAKRKSQAIAPPVLDWSGAKSLAQYTDAVPTGQGLYAGAHRGVGRGLHRRREAASVGIHGNLLGHGLPPALQSQPFSANFQFASRLPPAYAAIQKSGH